MMKEEKKIDPICLKACVLRVFVCVWFEIQVILNLNQQQNNNNNNTT
jgi:hypothetical protein